MHFLGPGAVKRKKRQLKKKKNSAGDQDMDSEKNFALV